MPGLFDSLPEPERSVYGVAPQVAQSAHGDPDTSREAADRMNDSGRARSNAVAVARLVRIKPGSTAVELLAKYEQLAPIGRWPKLDRHEISRRLPDAERFGWVRRGEARECGVTGTRMMTWWPVGNPSDSAG